MQRINQLKAANIENSGTVYRPMSCATILLRDTADMSRMQKDHIDRASMQKSFTAKNRFNLTAMLHRSTASQVGLWLLSFHSVADPEIFKGGDNVSALLSFVANAT